MFMASAVSLIVIVLGTIIAFLGKKHLKKFADFKKYTDLLPENRVTRLYCAAQAKPGMIIIRLASATPFTSLVAFEVAWPQLCGGRGVDSYGYVRGLQCTNGHYEAFFTAYLRNKPDTFVFPHTGETGVSAHIVPSELENDCLIQERFTPHWFRRMGI